jgi:hypothetical protein
MTIYHTLAILGPWAVWLGYWMKASSWAKKTVKREDRLSRTVQSIPLIVGCALVVLPDRLAGAWSLANTHFDSQQWTGIVIIVAGLTSPSSRAELERISHLKGGSRTGPQWSVRARPPSNLLRLPARNRRWRAGHRTMARRHRLRAHLRFARLQGPRRGTVAVRVFR